MINRKEFESINIELKRFEKERDRVILLSRNIIRMSKLIIYAIHRNDIKKALNVIGEIKKEFRLLPKDSYDANIQKTAIQEYVEALCYYEFVKNKRLPTRKELNVDTESYLLGLADLTGELVRKAVNDTIRKDHKQVILIKNFVEELYGEFLRFDLSSGDLRTKADSVRWNLSKLEDIAYRITS